MIDIVLGLGQAGGKNGPGGRNQRWGWGWINVWKRSSLIGPTTCGNHLDCLTVEPSTLVGATPDRLCSVSRPSDLSFGIVVAGGVLSL